MLYERHQGELEYILSPTYAPSPYVGLKAGQVVQTYQARAIDVLFRRKSLLLGDDLRLGNQCYLESSYIVLTLGLD